MNAQGERVVLALETAFPSVSVALQIGERIRVPETVPSRARASDLHPALEQCLASEGLVTGDIDLILVDKGPGSYTGLRIGLAVARTLMHLHDIPIRTLYSTDVLAWMGRDLVDPGEEYLVALDARRIHWTLASYRRTPDGESPVRLRKPEVLARADFVAVADQASLVVCAEDEPPTTTRVVQLGIPQAVSLFELQAMSQADPAPLPLYLMPAT
jgi:tRNA threonylcarbamoyl adenosine modification protein YeaZ